VVKVGFLGTGLLGSGMVESMLQRGEAVTVWNLQVFSKFQPGGVIRPRGEKIARGDFSASFELAMARKDMRLMLEAAQDMPMAVLPAIARRMDDLGAIAAEVLR
jgi:3-hydroxyisobutyrate dehydrogenase-like beta-hydroxyacid dehydrogenase